MGNGAPDCLHDLEELAQVCRGSELHLSKPMLFGLGAGLYFEYFARPHDSPSRRVRGFHRGVVNRAAERLVQVNTGDVRRVSRDALRENALSFNLDRLPTTGLLGMEMLAEQLPNFETVPDWRTCIGGMAHCIRSTDSLYRRLYAAFLEQVADLLDTRDLAPALIEIAQEWDRWGETLTKALSNPSHLEQAGSTLRRLAFREEHFWGTVLNHA
jgi:hypothetical protein